MKKLLDNKVPWSESAACRGLTDLFFPVVSHTKNRLATAKAVYKPALSICATCPVIEQCRALAMKVAPSEGVWAGETNIRKERLKWRKQQLNQINKCG